MINLWIIPIIVIFIAFFYNRPLFGYLTIGILILVNIFNINAIYKNKKKEKALKLLRDLIKVFLTVSGIKLQFENAEELNQHLDDNVLIMGNHTSNLDIMNIILNVKRPFFPMAKIELKKAPIVWKLLEVVGIIYIDRKDMRQSLKVIMQATKTFDKDNAFVVYPEGTRSETLGDIKAGSFTPISKKGGYIIITQNKNLRPCLETRKPFTIKKSGKTRVISTIKVEIGEKTVDIAKKVTEILQNSNF